MYYNYIVNIFFTTFYNYLINYPLWINLRLKRQTNYLKVWSDEMRIDLK